MKPELLEALQGARERYVTDSAQGARMAIDVIIEHAQDVGLSRDVVVMLEALRADSNFDQLVAEVEARLERSS
jgi:hypothetical protein